MNQIRDLSGVDKGVGHEGRGLTSRVSVLAVSEGVRKLENMKLVVRGLGVLFEAEKISKSN